jgi:hypothetical protein
MRKLGPITLIITVIVALASVTVASGAASPKFMSKFTSAARDGNNLVVDFKMSGLGSFATVDITTTASATREDSCVNNGGNIPADPKKTTTSATVSASGNFPVSNGQVTGTLTLSPPPTSLSCPGGQTATLISLTYTNVSISGAGIVGFQIAGTY